MTSRLKEKYQNEVVEKLIEKFGYKNVMQVPKLEKIVINVGLGEAKDNQNLLTTAKRELSLITGQQPIEIKAKNGNMTPIVRRAIESAEENTVLMFEAARQRRNV